MNTDYEDKRLTSDCEIAAAKIREQVVTEGAEAEVPEWLTEVGK